MMILENFRQPSMKRFDKKGMMLFPNPLKQTQLCESENIVVIEECFCPNGHNLISKKVRFNNFYGILIKVRSGEKEGYVALSPVYNDKRRISFDIVLKEKEIYEVICPECDVKLLKYSNCRCGADLNAMFLTMKRDFGHCIAFCNRVGCFNAGVIHQNHLLFSSGIDFTAM